MDIVISHLTRMNPGHVCAAGINLASHEHVRPVLPAPQLLPIRLCCGSSPMLQLRSILTLKSPKPRGYLPEVEDYECNLWELRQTRQMTQPEFWQLLRDMAKPNLHAIFGPTLEKTGKNYTLPPHTGLASLGCIHPASHTNLRVEADSFEEREQVKLVCKVDGVTCRLPVADLRFYSPTDFKIDRKLVNAVNGLLRGPEDLIICVGLTREWQNRHWLQVNGLHFERMDFGGLGD